MMAELLSLVAPRRAAKWLYVVGAISALTGCPSDKVDAARFATDTTQPDTQSAVGAEADAVAQDGEATADAADDVLLADADPTTTDASDGGLTVQDTDETGTEDAGDAATGPEPWAVEIQAGGGNTCAILSTGGLSCWGKNDNGEVGNGGAGGNEVNVPAAINGLKAVTEVAVGDSHACALHDGGKVLCWGDNFHSQLGNGTKHGNQATPTLTKMPITATHIGGSVDAMTATGDDKLYGWGNNWGDKQLSGTSASQPFPTVVTHAALTGAIKQICNGETVSCALGADSIVKCWGGSSWGEAGHDTLDTTQKPLMPKPVTGLSKVVGLTCGSWHGCAWNEAGKAWCWGKNLSGQLGNGGKKNVAAAIQVQGLSDVVHMAAGRNHTCATLKNGEVWCWGSNSSAQVTASPATKSALTPQKIDFAGKATRVAAGKRHSCLLTDSGDVYCWGGNDHGQIGDGTLTQQSKPVQAKPMP